MNASILLRLASVASLLFAAGHSLGGLQSWSPAGETQVLQAMTSFRFDVDGVSRTYRDFYIGFGLIISVFLFTQAVVLWQLATLSKSHPVQVRPMVVVLLIAVAANAALTWQFFFAVPLILACATTLLLGLALAAGFRT